MEKIKCKEIQKRINRIKGQINGVDKMVEEGRNSIEIIQQISAIKAALSKLGLELLKEESQVCLKQDDTAGKISKFEELVENFFKLT